MAKDRKIDVEILGLLSHEDLTGYDIKKRIDGVSKPGKYSRINRRKNENSNRYPCNTGVGKQLHASAQDVP